MYFVHRSVCRDFVLAFVLCVICAVCPLCPCQCERCPGRDLGHHSREVGKTKADQQLSSLQSRVPPCGSVQENLISNMWLVSVPPAPVPLLPPAGEFLPAVLSTPAPTPVMKVNGGSTTGGAGEPSSDHHRAGRSGEIVAKVGLSCASAVGASKT